MNSSIRDIGQRLQDEVEELAGQSLAEVYGRLPAYRSIEANVLIDVFRYNLSQVVDALKAGAVQPRFMPDQDASAILRDRLSRGLRIEDLITAYRIDLAVVHNRFIELAKEEALTLDMALAGSGLLWELGDRFIAYTIGAYQEIASSQAVRSFLERSDLVRELLFGAGATAVRSRLSGTGVNLSAPYAVIVANPIDGDLDRLTSSLEKHGSTPDARALITHIGGRCMGIVAARPDAVGTQAVVVMGVWTDLNELSDSLATAKAVWPVAQHASPGIHDIATTTWKVAVAQHGPTSDYLWNTYVAPIDPGTETGQQILETLVAFLACARSVRDTAEALFVHQNTVRYRLSRYEEQVEKSLTRTEDLVELAWALEVERRRQHPIDPDDAFWSFL